MSLRKTDRTTNTGLITLKDFATKTCLGKGMLMKLQPFKTLFPLNLPKKEEITCWLKVFRTAQENFVKPQCSLKSVSSVIA
jgi:hypothetical protein